MSFYETIDKVYHDWKYDHPKLFWSLIRMHKFLSIVDCGTYRGYSAAWMAKACQENNIGKVHCIDNFTLLDHVERYGDPVKHLEDNLEKCGVRQWVEIHKGESSDPSMWPETVDFCYVDGWHSYDQCKTDFEIAASRGASIVAFDDTENCVGPRLFIDTVFEWGIVSEKEWQLLDLHSDNGMAILSRKKPRRRITFSQELPLPNPGVDLRSMTLEEQAQHFSDARFITNLDYSSIKQHTEHA